MAHEQVAEAELRNAKEQIEKLEQDLQKANPVAPAPKKVNKPQVVKPPLGMKRQQNRRLLSNDPEEVEQIDSPPPTQPQKAIKRAATQDDIDPPSDSDSLPPPKQKKKVSQHATSKSHP